MGMGSRRRSSSTGSIAMICATPSRTVARTPPVSWMVSVCTSVSDGRSSPSTSDCTGTISQPRPSTSTPPTLGCRAYPRSVRTRAFAPSLPGTRPQPLPWVSAITPSTCG